MNRRKVFARVAAVVLISVSSVRPLPVQAAPEQSWTVASPTTRGGDGQPISARVDLIDGRLQLSATRGGGVVLRPAALGITTSVGDFTGGLSFVVRSDETIDERYTTVVGKRRQHRAIANQMTLRFALASGTAIDVVVRVADDGVAYRYRLPYHDAVQVVAESSSFAPPLSATAWLQPYIGDGGRLGPAHHPFFMYEYPYSEMPALAAIGSDYVYPALFEAEGDWMLLTESNVDGRYAASHLRGGPGGSFQVTFPYSLTALDRRGDPVNALGPLDTPWRVAIIGDLASVVESDLVEDLAAPSLVADHSWIVPGRAAWSWLTEPSSGSNLDRQLQYVDYASAQGWEYVVVDAGWDRAWVPDLVAYARDRGVRILLWTQYSEMDTDARRDAMLDDWSAWGVAGGKIDFTLCDCQARMQWFDGLLARLADLQMVVDFHGTTVPRGIQRTWPNVLTVEAVLGAEFYEFDLLGVLGAEVPPPLPPPRPTAPLVSPELLTTYPFTRNVVGSMDFTPVTFSTEQRQTSDGFELGEAVVFESGLQTFGDSIESYRARPIAAEILSEVPAVWDETELLVGQPGREAVIARRHGRDWWIGAISATAPRSSTVALDFLKTGTWLAHVVTDGPAGLTATDVVVTASDALTVDLTRHGGYVAHLTRAPTARSPQ